MANIVGQRDPWGEESSFEQLTSAPASTQVKKVVSDATKTMLAEVRAQILGGGKDNKNAQNQPPELQAKQVNEIKNNKEQKLAETRQNLERINAEIRKARENREREYQERIKKERQDKEKKMEVAQKKQQQENALQSAIKRGQGSGERGKVAG